MTSFKIAAAVAIAAFAPIVSHASGERSSANACAAAVAASLGTPGGVAPAYKLTFHPANSGGIFDFYPTQYTFTVEARDRKTGTALTRVQCSTNTKSAVTSLSAAR